MSKNSTNLYRFFFTLKKNYWALLQQGNDKKRVALSIL